MHMD
ncbi:rCG35487 [Rattus norvegicus]